MSEYNLEDFNATEFDVYQKLIEIGEHGLANLWLEIATVEVCFRLERLRARRLETNLTLQREVQIRTSISECDDLLYMIRNVLVKYSR